MAKFLEDFQSCGSNLLCQFFGVFDNNFSFGSNLGHDISQNDLNFGFDWGNNGINLVFDLIEFIRNFIGQISTSFLYLFYSILNSMANFLPKISKSIVLSSNNLLNDFGQSFCQKFEQKFLNEFMIFFKPLFSLQQGIMSHLSDSLQSSLTDLLGSLLCICQKFLGLSHEFGHNVFEDHLHFCLDGSHNLVDLIGNLGKFSIDSISKSASSFLHLVNRILDCGSNIIPKVSPAIVGTNGGKAFVFDAFHDEFGQLFREKLVQ